MINALIILGLIAVVVCVGVIIFHNRKPKASLGKKTYKVREISRDSKYHVAIVDVFQNGSIIKTYTCFNDTMENKFTSFKHENWVDESDGKFLWRDNSVVKAIKEEYNRQEEKDRIAKFKEHELSLLEKYGKIK